MSLRPPASRPKRLASSSMLSRTCRTPVFFCRALQKNSGVALEFNDGRSIGVHSATKANLKHTDYEKCSDLHHHTPMYTVYTESYVGAVRPNALQVIILLYCIMVSWLDASLAEPVVRTRGPASIRFPSCSVCCIH